MQSTPEASAASKLERRLDLAVEIAGLEQNIESRLRKMGRNVKMPGFRPGKVPFSIIKQQYGEQARSEALTEALDKVFGDAVREQSLRVAGYPRIEPKQTGSTTHVEFSAVFEVYPEVKVGDLAGQRVERPQFELGPQHVERTIDILRKQRVSYSDATRPAGKGDRVVIDFTGRKDGEVFQGGQANDYPFVLGEGAMLPEFEQAVEGLGVGQHKVFDLTFPADYFAKELAGQPVQFEVTVKAVQAAQLPEIDGEFARSMGIGSGDVGALRAEIEANLRREVKRRLKGRVKDQVMEALLKVTPIDLPGALVDAEVHRLMEAARQDMAQRGMKAKDLPMQPQWFAEQAKRRVALGLVLAELVKAENLHASAEQVRAMVEDFAQTYENPDEVVSWYYAQPQRLADVEALVLEDNVVDWVLQRATAVDKAVEFDDLMGRNA